MFYSPDKAVGRSRHLPLLCLLTGAILALLTPTSRATEDPPGCSLSSGGLGNTSQGGINFLYPQAHLGDTIEVRPNLGMVQNACSASSVTGAVYIASGFLTNFLVDVTLAPGNLISCPAGASCAPGPYSFTITPALVGAGINSPNGSIGGIAKIVRAVENGFGTVHTGDVEEQLGDFHSASVSIVSPCIQVTKTCSQACFPPGAPMTFTGIVTNCGDVTLTNVVATDSKTGPLLLLNPNPPFNPVTTLAPGAFARYTVNYTPTADEICGPVTNTVTVTAKDNTAIGGPNSFVTNSVTVACDVCAPNPSLAVTKSCPAGPVAPGGTLNFTGTVTNTGDITLTNVYVRNDQPILNITVLGPLTLAPGEGMPFSGNYIVPPDSCGPYADTVTATGASICGGVSVTNTATAICAATNTPCLSVTKTCSGPVLIGAPQTISGSVSNCGNVTITNIAVSDSILGSLTNIDSLAPGASAAYSQTFTASACGTTPDVVSVSGTSKCGDPVQASVTNSCEVSCPPPQICVTKLVACLVDADTCGTFGSDATGAMGITPTATNLPAFCYNIVVSNCGPVSLTNVTVIDDKFGDLSAEFFSGPTDVFAAGDSRTYTFKTALAADQTNTVNTAGQSVLTGASTTAQSSARAHVVPVTISCSELVTSPDDQDGVLNDNHVTIPNNGQPHNVTYTITINNASQTPLANVVVSNAVFSANSCPLPPSFSLAANSSTNFSCTVSINCADIPAGQSDTSTVTAQVDTESGTCGMDTNGLPVLTISQCSGSVSCLSQCGLSVLKTACVSPPQKQCPCVLGYPFVSANPRTSVVFNENECLAAFGPSFAGSNDTLKVWYTDEHAMTLGIRRVIVKTSSTTSNVTDYPVTPLGGVPDNAFNPAVGTTILSGPQAGTDPMERPIFPSLFITDITSDPNSRSNDWQYGGTPVPPNAVFGTWKGAIKVVDQTVNPATVTITTDADPAANGTNLGAGDSPPAGVLSQKWNAEARWNVSDLIAAGYMTNGHIYRVQVMVHDGDQNKTGGDVGETCGTVAIGTGTTCAGGTNVQVECTTELPDLSANSACDGAIHSLDLVYIGGGCANNQNSQGSSSTCTTLVNVTNASPVRLRITDGGSTKVFLDTGTPANVHLGDLVTVLAGKKTNDHFPTDLAITIYNSSGTQIEKVKFKSDCSKPVKLGDIFGGIEVVGLNGLSGGNSALGSSVLYTYEIKNEGSGTLTNVTVIDDVLGPVTGSPIPSLVSGQIVVLTEQVWIKDPVTNTVIVTGFQGNSSCTATGMAMVTRAAAPCPCVMDYPFVSPNPRTSVVFNESECLRAFSPTLAGSNDTLKVWYNDEHALTLGIRRVIVKTSSTTSNVTDYPVTPLGSVPGSATSPQVGTTVLSGAQGGIDPVERPIYPSLFITDITDNPTNRANDWQYGGTPIPPHAIFGAWKSAIKFVDQTVVPATVSVTPEADPAKNDVLGDSRLGPTGDIPPLGYGGSYPTANGTKTFNEGYTFEARWNIADLIAAGIMTNGRVYRVQFMVHDGDQNKTGGDVGESCATVGLGVQPPPCAPPTQPPAQCTSGIVAFYAKWTGSNLDPGSTMLFIGTSGAIINYTFASGLTNGATISLPSEGDSGHPWTIDASKHGQTVLGTKTYVYINGTLTEILNTSCTCTANNFIPGQPACLDSSSPDNSSAIKGAPSPLFQVLDFKN